MSTTRDETRSYLVPVLDPSPPLLLECVHGPDRDGGDGVGSTKTGSQWTGPGVTRVDRRSYKDS